MARTQERRVPHLKATYYSGEGRWIFFRRIGDILAELPAVCDRNARRSST
jgi:hypothetical protein